ncbi:MAG: LysR substrate-binding domain-containing protein, partial [Geminicoccaceae bacterium]
MQNDRMMDWDRVRVFHAVAHAGSFTRAAERLGLSQSAISRQISGLEEDLATALFHRHARGLVLTEQGEILLQAADEIAKRMASVETSLGNSRDCAAGHLRINTTIGLGTIWLVSQLSDFVERHPDIRISLIIGDNDVDLSMREADVAIRVARPTQPDLIQRRLMTVNTHIYATPGYLERHGVPQTLDDLDRHWLIAYGQDPAIPVASLNWVLTAGKDDDENGSVRVPHLTVNNVFGMLRAAESGLGLASLPDYLGATSGNLKRVLEDQAG